MLLNLLRQLLGAKVEEQGQCPTCNTCNTCNTFHIVTKDENAINPCFRTHDLVNDPSFWLFSLDLVFLAYLFWVILVGTFLLVLF